MKLLRPDCHLLDSRQASETFRSDKEKRVLQKLDWIAIYPSLGGGLNALAKIKVNENYNNNDWSAGCSAFSGRTKCLYNDKRRREL
jgi:hypothetical protein